MSGDVQPRKRKDKKRKKDELSVEEPKGTSAIFGEGDVFLHSQHEHGTGGHWCAKIIFFSLLAVLVTLIALIIMENRGLSELEANSIESRYSGMLEGWLEEGADDDHHDAHTLELKHHDEDEEENQMSEILEHHSDEEVEETQEKREQPYFFMSYFGGDSDNANGDDDHEEDRDDEDNDVQNSNEKDLSDDDEGFYEASYNRQNFDNDDEEDDNINDKSYHAYQYSEDLDDEDDRNNDDQYEDKNDEDDDVRYDATNDEDYIKNDDEDDDDKDENGGDKYENDVDNEDENADEKDEDENKQTRSFTEDQDDDDDLAYFTNYDKYKDDHGDGDEDDDGDDHDDDDDEHIEIEKIEREVNDDEPISVELPALPEEDDDEDDGNDNNDDDDNDDTQEDDEFLDNDVDEDLPVVEHITAPSGKPFKEVEDDYSTEQTPVDTLADEEEYEKRQEEIRREQEEASNLWLRVGVGCALVVATLAVVRRALSTGNERENETQSREETPLSERRMTLVLEQATPARQIPQERPRKVIQEEISKHIPAIIQSAPTPTQMSLDDEIEDEESPLNEQSPPSNIDIDTVDKELYSDEDEEIVEEEEKEEVDGSEAEEELLDDVEVIEDEQIEEEQIDEQIDEEDEDEISDVDDAELLNRLEAKYGKLPEDKNKEGGKSIEDDLWPDEPSDPFWKQELDRAEDDFRQGRFESALTRVAATALKASSRARWLQAATLDAQAETKRDNTLLTRAITVYRSLLLDFNEKLSDNKLFQITNRTIDRMIFRGAYLSADPIYRLLIRRFPDEIGFRNNLTISFLMANRADLAANVLNETLKKWPKDPIALVHYAFVLKTHYNKLEESVELFRKALKDENSPASEPRFYYHYGDALLLLGRRDEAEEVHKRGARLGHFLSPMQRSLYNVDRLKSRPWWDVEDTPYAHLARRLEANWEAILREGMSAKQLYEEEREGLRERGQWSQLDLYARGSAVAGRCERAPVTCGAVRSERAAVSCRRGQIKFSAMEPGTHVRAHTGPTNCRLRMHLALSNTTGTYMRVGTQTRQWKLGKVWLFDDSFEHEVWHNGTGTRLVLIVDVWHPDLTPQERRQLPAI